MDPKAFFKLSYGLYIISTENEGKQAGCIANTFNQVTSSPAQVSVTLNKNNATEQMIEKSGKFAVAVLEQSATMELSAGSAFTAAAIWINSADWTVVSTNRVCHL